MSTAMPEQVTHLWEVEHPYYCHGYYSESFESWADMKAAADDMDGEYNLLIRWDWHSVDDVYDVETLELAFAQQRKGLTMTWSCPIGAADEDDVRSWLIARSIDLRRLWAPLDLVAPSEQDGDAA
jgi:hypothetical protein